MIKSWTHNDIYI